MSSLAFTCDIRQHSFFTAEEKFADFENGVENGLELDNLRSISDVDLGERFAQSPEADRSNRCFYSRKRASEEIEKKEHLEVLNHLIRSADRTGASLSQ